jgi:hypothetical protein
MDTNNVCPDCKKSYEKMPERCICGWYLVKENKSNKDNGRCLYFEESGRCKELGSVALRAKSHDWYCGDHARKLREESYQRIQGFKYEI